MICCRIIFSSLEMNLRSGVHCLERVKGKAFQGKNCRLLQGLTEDISRDKLEAIVLSISVAICPWTFVMQQAASSVYLLPYAYTGRELPRKLCSSRTENLGLRESMKYNWPDHYSMQKT